MTESGVKPVPAVNTLHVSDSQAIINLLFNSPFYGAYISYYRYPGFYRDDLAADFLFARGIADEKEKFPDIEKILGTFSIDDKSIIADLLLILNTVSQYFENQNDRVSEEPFITNDFKTLKEILTLNNLMKSHSESKPGSKTSIEFKIGREKYTITGEFVVNDIFRHIKDLAETSEYQSIFKFSYLEENEDDYYNFLNFFPGEEENRCETNLIKLWIIKRSVLLLTEYWSAKNLAGMSHENKVITDSAAEITGKLLSLVGFIPAEAEFSNNMLLKTDYESYRDFLIKTIKYYFNSGQTSARR